MKIKDRKRIDRSVRKYIKNMNLADPEYLANVSKDVVITEIIRSNEWFCNMNYPLERIREEVELQLDTYTTNGKLH